eukprot:TRINITY_DN825_c0_g1_i1.p1 TRINITY_DN825_c0_g1~~TRINITY_DN825_c0_g1_i1.p1  ORF type:complete len:237 (+),score=70.94 TRINITY_DN825_c0_g1_i1:270-980(+)
MEEQQFHDLEYYKIGNIPSVYYIPNFLSESEENEVVNNIYKAPQIKWVKLRNRRLQEWGGTPTEKGMIQVDLPEFLNKVGEKIHKAKFIPNVPNHVLVNEYAPGQGIMRHEDGPLYVPHFSILNLKSTILLDVYKHTRDILGGDEDSDENQIEDRVFSIALRPRALLIVKDEVYTNYMHGIEERMEDVVDDKVINLEQTGLHVGDVIKRELRISATIREVKLVLKKKIFNLFNNKK